MSKSQFRIDNGIVICPDLDSFDLTKFIDSFDEVTPCEGWVELWINGNGGSTGAETAICDFLGVRGRVRGVMFGEANSAHGLIWACCPKRAVGRNAVLGVHRTQYTPNSANYSVTDFRRATTESHYWDERAAKRYAKISGKSEKWWLRQMENAGNGLTIFTAKQLVKMGMGDWYKP